MDRSRIGQPRAAADEPLGKPAEANFLFLLAGLLALLCFMPAFERMSRGHMAFTLLLVFLSGTLLLASWTFRTRRRLFLTDLALAATAFLLSIATAVTGSEAPGYVSLVANIAFWCLCTWIVCGQVLSAGPVTLNRIIGSVCIYMMVADIFALLNVLVNRLLPGSFSNLRADGLQEELPEFVYYSFVTLNTLGYGDISPIGSFARMLAILESTFGVFYLAILVASLVGMGVSHQASTVGDPHRATPATSDEDSARLSE